MNNNKLQRPEVAPILLLLSLILLSGCGNDSASDKSPEPAKDVAGHEQERKSSTAGRLREPADYVNTQIVSKVEVEKMLAFFKEHVDKAQRNGWQLPSDGRFPLILDAYPPRAKGEYIDAFFSKAGLLEAFNQIADFGAPLGVQPIIGKVSSISSRPQFLVQAYYKVPPEQVEALAKKVADSWRAKFPVSKGSLPWSLVGPKPRMPPGAPGQYGLAYGPRTFSYRLEDPDSPPHHTRSIVADPDSGLISLSHWEGDQD